MELTYPYAAATRDDALPPGYRHVRRRVRVGVGEAAFAALTVGMRVWGIHRGAGLQVRASGPLAPGEDFAAGMGVGPLRLWVPARVVWLRDEPTAYGYGFGTLPGHPERGEEAFLATMDDAGGIWFEVRAFSRPATWYARLGGPAAHWLQDLITDRYVTAARQLVRTGQL